MFKSSHIFPTWMPFAFMASYNAFEFTFFTSYALLDSSSKNFVHSNPSAAAIRFAIFTDGRLLSLSIEA